MRKLVVGTLIAAFLVPGFSNAAMAQEPTATPTAAACTTAPIAFERLASISATPAASPEAVNPNASPVVSGLPQGEPADVDTTSALQATVIQLIACLNGGDTLRTLALYSDPFINASFGGLDITQKMYDDEGANVLPRPEGQEVLLVAFGDAVILPDGRAAIIVVGDDLASPGASSETLFTLINVDGVWLIDETQELTEPTT